METSLKNKVVLVTGSARRVGRAIMMSFAREGAHVVIHHHSSPEEAESAAAEARALGVEALVIQGNHAQHAEVAANFDAVRTHFGRLDILVNSAGVFKDGDLLDISPEEWETVISANLSAPFWCTQQAGRLMRDSQAAGVIINIGDNGGLRPWEKRPHHSISKAGVVMLTEVTAKSLSRYGIRANCIVPGPVLPSPGMDEAYWNKVTERILLKRSGEPEDISRAAVFIAKNDFITGAILRVDGGEFFGNS
jgi:NAD(P)-dependent dehydrogenase (short-subunit alcohol dehydrogenase family)